MNSSNSLANVTSRSNSNNQGEAPVFLNITYSSFPLQFHFLDSFAQLGFKGRKALRLSNGLYPPFAGNGMFLDAGRVSQYYSGSILFIMAFLAAFISIGIASLFLLSRLRPGIGYSYRRWNLRRGRGRRRKNNDDDDDDNLNSNSILMTKSKAAHPSKLMGGEWHDDNVDDLEKCLPEIPLPEKPLPDLPFDSTPSTLPPATNAIASNDTTTNLTLQDLDLVLDLNEHDLDPEEGGGGGDGGEITLIRRSASPLQNLIDDDDAEEEEEEEDIRNLPPSTFPESSSLSSLSPPLSKLSKPSPISLKDHQDTLINIIHHDDHDTPTSGILPTSPTSSSQISPSSPISLKENYNHDDDLLLHSSKLPNNHSFIPKKAHLVLILLLLLMGYLLFSSYLSLLSSKFLSSSLSSFSLTTQGILGGVTNLADKFTLDLHKTFGFVDDFIGEIVQSISVGGVDINQLPKSSLGNSFDTLSRNLTDIQSTTEQILRLAGVGGDGMTSIQKEFTSLSNLVSQLLREFELLSSTQILPSGGTYLFTQTSLLQSLNTSFSILNQTLSSGRDSFLLLPDVPVQVEPLIPYSETLPSLQTQISLRNRELQRAGLNSINESIGAYFEGLITSWNDTEDAVEETLLNLQQLLDGNILTANSSLSTYLSIAGTVDTINSISLIIVNILILGFIVLFTFYKWRKNARKADWVTLYSFPVMSLLVLTIMFTFFISTLGGDLCVSVLEYGPPPITIGLDPSSALIVNQVIAIRDQCSQNISLLTMAEELGLIPPNSLNIVENITNSITGLTPLLAFGNLVTLNPDPRTFLGRFDTFNFTSMINVTSSNFQDILHAILEGQGTVPQLEGNLSQLIGSLNTSNPPPTSWFIISDDTISIQEVMVDFKTKLSSILGTLNYLSTNTTSSNGTSFAILTDLISSNLQNLMEIQAAGVLLESQVQGSLTVYKDLLGTFENFVQAASQNLTGGIIGDFNSSMGFINPLLLNVDMKGDDTSLIGDHQVLITQQQPSGQQQAPVPNSLTILTEKIQAGSDELFKDLRCEDIGREMILAQDLLCSKIVGSFDVEWIILSFTCLLLLLLSLLLWWV